MRRLYVNCTIRVPATRFIIGDIIFSKVLVMIRRKNKVYAAEYIRHALRCSASVWQCANLAYTFPTAINKNHWWRTDIPLPYKLVRRGYASLCMWVCEFMERTEGVSEPKIRNSSAFFPSSSLLTCHSLRKWVIITILLACYSYCQK